MAKSAPNKVKLTNAKLKQIAVKRHDKVTFYRDTESPLTLKVTPSQTMTWLCIYKHRHQARFYTLGRYQDRTGQKELDLDTARQSARKVKAEAWLGKDPQGAKAALKHRDDTFSDLAEEYFEFKRQRNFKSLEQYRNQWERHIKPKLGKRPAEALKHGDFEKLMDGISPGSRHSVIAIAQGILKHAIKRERVPFRDNPAYGVDIDHKPKRKDPLKDDEIRTLWAALPGIGEPWNSILKVSLLTGGLRANSDICKMRWDEIDGEWWNDPTSKNGKPHTVFLCPTVRDIIEQQPKSNEFVFGGAVIKQRVRDAIKTATGIDMTPHYLRNTAEDLMCGLGISEETRRRVQGHTMRGMTAVYGSRNNTAQQERAALIKLEQHIHGILEPTESDNVVRL